MLEYIGITGQQLTVLFVSCGLGVALYILFSEIYKQLMGKE